MSLPINLLNKLLAKLRKQISTLTREDIIVTLNIIFLVCKNDAEIKKMVTNIAKYYQQEDEAFDSELFTKNLLEFLMFLDKRV